MGREEFVQSLPLPLAQMWRRAHDTVRQPARARDLLEIAIRLRAAVESPASAAAETVILVWNSARTAASTYFARRVSAESTPGIAALAIELGLERGTIGDVVHRALESDEESPALLGAAREFLRDFDVLDGRRLLYSRGDAVLELRGETPEFVEEKEPLARDRVVVVGRGAPVDLHSVARFDPDTVEFFLRVGAEWICHATGRRRSARLADETPTIPADALASGQPTRPRTEERQPERPRLGEFVLLSRIGAGAMGIVYRAWQPSLGRAVAVKCLRAGDDEKAFVRFDREVRGLGRVEHPNLVKIFTSGNDGGQRYYAMELVEGVDLERITRKLAEAAPPSEIGEHHWISAISRATTEAKRTETVIADEPDAVDPVRSHDGAGRVRFASSAAGAAHVERSAEIVRQIAEAAHALHDAGLVHRDIKPGNVVLSSDGSHATLMDLSLVRPFRERADDAQKTQNFVGTLRYASPEQLLGEGELTRAADVYSLGVTLYELLTLQPIFGATNSMPTPIVIGKILSDEPVRPRKLNPSLPRDLEAIVLKCLEKDSKRRYATARELAEDLARWQAMEPVRAKRDGFFGRFVRQGRRLSVVHPWAFAAAVVAFAFAGTVAFLEIGGGGQRFFDRAFGTTLRTYFKSARSQAAWEEMAIVAFDARSLEALPGIARGLGLDGVDPEKMRTWRPVHGAMMKRLAAARPAVVVWDFVFDASDPKLDADLAAGLDALRASGARVVLGVMAIDDAGDPVLASDVRGRCDAWGWIFLAQETIDGDYVTGGCLAVSHPPFEIALGLPLAAYIGYRHPRCYQRIDFVEQNTYLDIHCGKNCPSRADEDASAGGERIFFADVEPENSKGLPRAMDFSKRRVACPEVGFPGSDVIGSRTISYADVFASSDADLASRVGGKVVFIGETRLDRHVIDRSGRKESGVAIHAATTGDLIANVEYTRHGLLLEYLLLPAFAGLGLVLLRSSPFASLALRSAAAFGGLVALSCLTTVVAAGAWRILLSPTELVVVSFLAIAAAAALHGGSSTALILKTPSTVEGRNGSTRRSSP